MNPKTHGHLRAVLLVSFLHSFCLFSDSRSILHYGVRRAQKKVAKQYNYVEVSSRSGTEFNSFLFGVRVAAKKDYPSESRPKGRIQISSDSPGSMQCHARVVGNVDNVDVSSILCGFRFVCHGASQLPCKCCMMHQDCRAARKMQDPLRLNETRWGSNCFLFPVIPQSIQCWSSLKHGKLRKIHK